MKPGRTIKGQAAFAAALDAGESTAFDADEKALELRRATYAAAKAYDAAEEEAANGNPDSGRAAALAELIAAADSEMEHARATGNDGHAAALEREIRKLARVAK